MLIYRLFEPSEDLVAFNFQTAIQVCGVIPSMLVLLRQLCRET